jgi:hypothetical protein
MFITRKEFQNYRGCSLNTATKKYREYLKKADKDKDQELTIYDLSRIDNLPVEIVKQRCKM